jgi:hypothetical protein
VNTIDSGQRFSLGRSFPQLLARDIGYISSSGGYFISKLACQ